MTTPTKGLRIVLMSIVKTFRSLPSTTKRLLAVGVVVAFVVALPLFVWGVTSLNFNPNKRADEPVSTPTLTPSPSPLPTFSPSPSPTILPTGTPPPTSRPFEILLKLEGVTDDAANFAKVSTRLISKVLNNSAGYVTPDLPIIYVGNGIYKLNFGVWSEELPTADDYVLVVKGEKHLGIRFCSESGQTQHCSGGSPDKISLPQNPRTKVLLDFTGIPLAAGDTPPQDGVVNLADYERVKGLLSKPCSLLTAQERFTADLNYDGCVTTKDIFLIRKTLEVRYDEN